MKKIFIFNLPDDKADFEVHNNGPAYYSALVEMRTYLRNKRKYEIDNLTSDQKKLLEEIFQQFWQILQDEEISHEF